MVPSPRPASISGVISSLTCRISTKPFASRHKSRGHARAPWKSDRFWRSRICRPADREGTRGQRALQGHLSRPCHLLLESSASTQYSLSRLSSVSRRVPIATLAEDPAMLPALLLCCTIGADEPRNDPPRQRGFAKVEETRPRSFPHRIWAACDF